MRPATNALRMLVLCPGLAYLVVVVAMFAGQRLLIFPAPPPGSGTVPRGAERVEVKTEGGTIPVDRSGPEGAPLTVFFHGNAEDLGDLGLDAHEAAAAGLAFAAVEYPGYGQANAGGPSEDSLLAAARAGIAGLDAARPPTCVGHSLGSGVAVAMAAEGRCGALVAISAYTSMADMAAAQVPWVPGRWLVLDRFDSIGRAARIAVPTLVIHGRRDDLVPLAMGERLAAAIPGARFVARDRGHNDIRDGETWAAIAAFVGVGQGS